MSDLDAAHRALSAIGLTADDVPAHVTEGLRQAAAKGPKQLSRADLKGMTPGAINKAREEGRLDDLLGSTNVKG